MSSVKMEVTDKDRENADRIQDYINGASRAHAVSVALSLTAFITNRIASGDTLLLRAADGSVSRVHMDELA